jgi:CHRD domain-containing protein
MKSRVIIAVTAIALLGALVIGGTTSFANRGGKHGKANRGKRVVKRSTLFAVLNGRNELNATTLKRGAGDPDGFGSANVLTAKSDTVCFGISVTGIGTPTAAHIHRGKRNQNGPVVIPLTAPTSGDPGASSGCVSGVATSLVSELRQKPHRFYVNVHTTDFTGGAIRGQLH